MTTDPQPPGTTSETSDSGALFQRRSSGLVRTISPRNALFFNVAAFVGTILTFCFLQYSVSFEPNWTFGFSAYAWSAIAVGAACILLAVIFVSLASVMPRTGGDYVFTSRIISPFLGWIESWGLVWGSLSLIAVVLPVVLLQLSYVGEVLHIAFPHSSLWSGATGWFSSSHAEFIGGTVVLLLGLGFALLPPRLFHRILTVLAFGALCAGVVLFICTILFVSKGTFLARLPHYTGGETAQHIIRTAAYPTGGFNFSAFMIIGSIVLLAYIGFQYSAYIAGEVAGSVKRSTLYALFGALAVAVVMNSVYLDLMARKYGIPLITSWGSLFWSGATLPGGFPPIPPLLGAVTHPGLWPVWVAAMMASLLLTFLVLPVYIVFISRMFLAWTLDRQAPSWIAQTKTRWNIPVVALGLCAVISEVFLYFDSYRGLKLASSIWFSALLLSFTWIIPGFNAIFAKRRRPQFFSNAPYGRWLPWIGLAWLTISLAIYGFAVIKPIVDALTAPHAAAGQYIKNTGILATLITLAVGVVAYFANVVWNRLRHVDREMMFSDIPAE